MSKDTKGALSFGKIFKKAKDYIGLDIGSSSVKLVRLAKMADSDKVELSELGYSFLPNDSPEAIKSAIKDLATQVNLPKDSEVVANIPNNSAITRYVLMPKMNSEELRRAVGFELEKYIAFDVKDAVYDFTVLDDTQVKQGNVKILLVITKKETIEERANLIEEAGFIPKVVTIDSVVMKNVFYFNYPDKKDKNIALVDLGSRLASITIVKGGLSNFMRDIAIGSENIITLACEKMEMQKNDAIKMLDDVSLQTAPFKEIVNSVFSNLLNELYLSFDYYETQFESGIEEVYITGGLSHLPGLGEFLSKNLGVTLSQFDPLRNFSIKPELQAKAQKMSHALSVAIGLALEDT